MAAGLGFKDFTTGEVLTAADVDGYLMQGVLVFASSAARDAAITSPQEGQFAFLKDTNTTMYYTGSAWTNLDTTGLTNPMTTTGDMIYSSPGSTPVRIGIGSTGQVLTVASGIPSWAAPAAGGKVLQVVNNTYGTQVSTGTSTFIDTGLTATITPSSASSKILIIGTQAGMSKSGSATAYWRHRLLRGSTVINLYETSAGYDNTNNFNNTGSQPFTYLDSPATTSATTYKTQINNEGNSGTCITQNGSECTSVITLLEIGA